MSEKHSATALLGLSPKDRAYAEQRQKDNGYRDIDGLTDELQQRGADCTRARAGRINAYLKEQARLIGEKQRAAKEYLDALGPNGNDIGLVNIALLSERLMEMLPEFEFTAEELQSLPLDIRLKVFFGIVDAQRALAQAQKPLRTERRTDMKAQEAKLAELEKASKVNGDALDPDTIQKVRQIYGWQLDIEDS